MKENHLKRLLSFVLVIAMVVSLCPTIAFAGDTLPYQGESALKRTTSPHLTVTGPRTCCPGIRRRTRTRSFCGRGCLCRTALKRLQPPGQPQPEPGR